MDIPSRLRRINSVLDRVLFWCITVTAMLFFAVVFVAVLTRYLFKTPLPASIELSRLFFVWSCLLGAALTYRRRAHVGITMVFEKLSGPFQRGVLIILYLLILVFCWIIWYQSILVTWLLWQTDLPMLGVSQSWFYLPVPIICMLFITFTFEFMWTDLRVNPSNGA